MVSPAFVCICDSNHLFRRKMQGAQARQWSTDVEVRSRQPDSPAPTGRQMLATGGAKPQPGWARDLPEMISPERATEAVISGDGFSAATFGAWEYVVRTHPRVTSFDFAQDSTRGYHLVPLQGTNSGDIGPRENVRIPSQPRHAPSPVDTAPWTLVRARSLSPQPRTTRKPRPPRNARAIIT